MLTQYHPEQEKIETVETSLPSTSNKVTNKKNYYNAGRQHISNYKYYKRNRVYELKNELLNETGKELIKKRTGLRREKLSEAIARITNGKLYLRLEALAKTAFPDLDKTELDAAIVDFNAAIQQDPTQAHNHYRRGWAYQEKGEFASAIKDFEKAIQLVSHETNARRTPRNDLIRYYAHYAKSHHYQGQSALGIEILTDAINKMQQDPWLYYYRAELYLQTGQLHLALVDIMEAESVNDQHFLNAELRTRLKILLHTKTKEAILEVIRSKGNDLSLDLKIQMTNQIVDEENSLLGQKFREQRGSEECTKGQGKLNSAVYLRERLIKEKHKKELGEVALVSPIEKRPSRFNRFFKPKKHQDVKIELQQVENRKSQPAV